MKKSLLFLGLFGTIACVTAQNALTPKQQNKPLPVQRLHYDASKLKTPRGHSGDRVSQSFWLNYGSSIDQLNNGGAGSTGTSDLNSNYLFPDSTVNGEFGAGNFSSVWVHHLGDILDVKSDVFDLIDNCSMGVTDAYSVDSMSIVYGYNRNYSDPNVVDTLVITLLQNNPATNMPASGYIAPTATNYGTDTLSVKMLNYSFANNLISGSGKYTFKVLLTGADTATTFYRDKMIGLPVQFNVLAGKLLGADVMFKPGYTWTSGDQIDYTLNAFFFTSYEENGAGTYQTYFDCNYQSVACDYNVSSIVPQDVRYNQAGGYNGKFIPSYAYTVGYGFEHHLISYKITTPPNPLGVNETAAANQFASQNQPNPFSDQTTINYELTKPAGTVTVQIYDITGVKLFDESQSNVKAGTYSVAVNTADYASGLYFYSVIVDGVKVTKKMVAQK